MTKRFWIALVIALIFAPVLSYAQTAKQLETANMGGKNVLTIGMGYDLQRFSPLKQIDAETVKSLVPVWAVATGNNVGEEGQPLVYDGVMYFTNVRTTFAIDAATGRILWKNQLDIPADAAREACCGQDNRGPALYEGKLYRTTLDARVIAMDAKTGKVLWQRRVADYKLGMAMTVAPLVADGVVMTGIAGGEYGVRGFLDGWDAASGKHLWRTYTVPKPGEKGANTWPDGTWKHGGGAIWITGSYDPKLDLAFWGTGNPGPWNARIRKGDNLYTDCAIAIRPKTGKMVWHYQFTPNDPFDYDGVNELVETTLKIGGRDHQVVMEANRNGFLYVIDRTDGRLLAAHPFVKVTWATGINMETGRPIESALTKEMRATGKEVGIAPSAFGGKNWEPMSYNPETGLLYLNALHSHWDYRPVKPKYSAGRYYFGAKFTVKVDPKEGGSLDAIDPVTGKIKWSHPWVIPVWSGTLTTAGNLVFSGDEKGIFHAFDASTGKELWRYQTSSGINSQPIAWEENGREYITVASGLGGLYPLVGGDERLANVPVGGAIWTFALYHPYQPAQPALSAQQAGASKGAVQVAAAQASEHLSPEAQKGAQLYSSLCARCHGPNMVSPGTNAFDLRKFPKDQHARFVHDVLNGKGGDMPPWKGLVTDKQIDELWAYVKTGGK